MRAKDWESALTAHLQKRADRQLPPGQRLDVTFDDIKLAGDYEPWHSPQAQDIRFMKDIYPPRATLNYKLTDADGRTIKEGSSKLLDMALHGARHADDGNRSAAFRQAHARRLVAKGISRRPDGVALTASAAQRGV